MRPFVLSLVSTLICAMPAYAEEGIASWYGYHEAGRPMSNGHLFRPLGDNAASRTWALGTHLVVTNLANGRHADVVIEDRGPYVRPRILDVSLGTARILGFEHQGLARVRIEPVAPVAHQHRVKLVHHRRTKHHRHAAK